MKLEDIRKRMFIPPLGVKLSQWSLPEPGWVVDIEADNLLPDVTQIHCAVAYNLADDEVLRWTSNHKDKHGSIAEFVSWLGKQQVIWGHNLINYDLPVIRKATGAALECFNGQEGIKVFDSMVLSRLIWSDITSMDFENISKGVLKLPDKKAVKELAGSHSLRAWGYRLDYYKGNREGQVDFATYTPEMLEYCERDVILNVKLIQAIQKKDPTYFSVWLEHQFYRYLEIQQQVGVGFDEDFALELCGWWEKELERRVHEMKAVIPDILIETPYTPKVNRPDLGYEKGKTIIKKKVIPFNPRSNDHIIGFLMVKYGWEPKEFTKTKSDKWPAGKPTVTYEILKALPYSEAPLLARIKLLMDRIGLVKTEKTAWLKCSKGQGRIFGRIIHNGTPTARCRHMAPNLGNIPSAASVWGKTLRKLFRAATGFKLVGTDFDSLEMACLAEALYDYDGGAFYQMAFSGNKDDGTDPHSLNRDAIRRELETAGFHKVAAVYNRDRAKTNFYAYIYGAWPRKLGMVAAEGLGVPPGKYSLVGNAVKAGLAQNIVGLADLVAKLEMAYEEALAQKKWPHIELIDGRMVPIRKKTALLNSLLQAMGAILCKLACVFKLHLIEGVGERWRPVLHVHDETQDEVIDERQFITEFQQLVAECFRKSGEYFNLRIPVGGTASVGSTWAETH